VCVCVCVCARARRSDACNLVPSQKDTVEISLEPLESEQLVFARTMARKVWVNEGSLNDIKYLCFSSAQTLSGYRVLGRFNMI